MRIAEIQQNNQVFVPAKDINNCFATKKTGNANINIKKYEYFVDISNKCLLPSKSFAENLLTICGFAAVRKLLTNELAVIETILATERPVTMSELKKHIKKNSSTLSI